MRHRGKDMKTRAFVSMTLIVLLAGSVPVRAAAAAAPDMNNKAAAPQWIGKVTAAFGHAKIESDGVARTADLTSLVGNDERVQTNGGGLTILLASRVVLKIDVDSAVRISEGVGQTNIMLERGTVHLFVGRRPATAGAVAVLDGNVRAEATTGVFLASYDPSAKTGYYACEHGTVTIDPAVPTKKDGDERYTLVADTQLAVMNGSLSTITPLERVAFNDRKKSLDRLGQS